MTYRRTIDPSGRDSLAKLARWIRPGSTVLELGCAAGYFTAHLREQGCTVDVVEVDARAAREASQHARRTVVADLEGDVWTEKLSDVRYDSIVCADVLEHLRDGARLLARLRPLLADGGELVLSVPNVAHSAVVASLVDDRFDYGGEGLLDPTHLRLYTWRSLARLLHDTGFGIVEWDATTLTAFDTEFRIRTEALAPALREALARRPRGLAYQWLVRAVPGVEDRAPEPSGAVTGERIPVRLLHADSAEVFSLEAAVVAELPVGGAPAALEWQWTQPARALRLLLADRIGVMRVLDCRLHRGNEVLWSYEGDEASLELGLPVLRLDQTTFALTAPNGWIAPVVDPTVAARADRMTATLAWPDDLAKSGEFAVLARLSAVHMESVEAAGRRHDELVEVAHLHQRNLLSEMAAHAAAREERDQLQTAVAELTGSVAACRQENDRLEAAIKAQERIIAYRQSARWWLALPLLRLKLWWRRVTGR